MLLAACVLSAPVAADVSGFVQLRQAERVRSASGCAVQACTTMVQEFLAELLVQRRLSDRSAFSLRTEATYDNAISYGRIAIREGFVDSTPASSLDLKLGRQVITWGVSDYLYVNDVFPKNYDAFFTGGGFDRLKEPVDAARLTWHGVAAGVEGVVSRAKADRSPSPERFLATTAVASATIADDASDRVDAALKVSTNRQGLDLAAYAASFSSRELRYFMDETGLRSDQPRMQHLGFSLTGNAAAGVVWLEGGIRHTDDDRMNVVSRHSLGSSAKMIAGYSREVAQDITASAQLQLEAATDWAAYARSLAPGVRPVQRVGTILHLRVQGRWMNQTMGAGAQLFAGSEGDTHFNPFLSWSPADGWTMEGGANLFDGEPDTRYGALRRDSNVYVLGRRSF